MPYDPGWPESDRGRDSERESPGLPLASRLYILLWVVLITVLVNVALFGMVSGPK
jgi:hypothetical protein